MSRFKALLCAFRWFYHPLSFIRVRTLSGTANIISALLLVISTGVAAQDAETEALKTEMRELKQRMEELEERLEVEEAAEKTAPAVEEAAAPAVELTPPAWPVVGIYTAPDTKDLGQLTGFSWLSGVKARGWIDTYYVYNFNEPDRSTVNNNQAFSAIKGRDVSIEGRTFDTHHNSFTLSLAELEIEKVPQLGGVGFKFDIAFGETQDIIVDTIKGAVGPAAASDSVTDFDKTFQQASVGYLAPLGRGLRIDAGKFVTHIGGETIETIKNWNYSHSFFYTYAIPFQDTGVHVSYPWSDTFYTDFYVLNGWNVTIDNNDDKTFGPAIGWIPMPGLAIYANYLGGPEQTDNDSDWRHLVDTQIFLGPFDRWNFLVNFDYGVDQNERNAAAGLGVKDAKWWGLAGYARYKVNDYFEPSFRLEYYSDNDGFTTLFPQELWGATLSLNTTIGLGKATALLLRPEVRYDISDMNFFTEDTRFRTKHSQWTAGLGAVFFF
ncbi:MAG: porin [Gammaproteobacteria bacterium]|nr:porin [Gammaproteobacteria bacterium]